MKNFLQRIQLVGISEHDSLDIRIGKQYYNLLLILTFLFNAFTPLFMCFFLEDISYIVLYTLINAAIVIIGYWLNYKNLFVLSANFVSAAVSINTLIFTYIIFLYLESFPFVIFYVIKLFYFLLFIISLFLRTMLKYKYRCAVIITLAGFYLLDFVYVMTHNIQGKDFYLDIFSFDILITVQIIIFFFSYRYLVRFQDLFTHNIIQRQNTLDATLRSLSNEKQEITTNIEKASRFLDFILPQPEEIREFFDDYFIVYKPTLFLSGDFYYFKNLGDKVLIILADSMGHGISAAFVNMFVLGILETRNYPLDNPAKMLERLKEMLNTHKKIPWDVDVAFDIVIMMYDPGKRELIYSSAFLPIIIARNGEYIKLSYYKSSISQFSKQTKFFNHTHKLQPGDILYVFTDGIKDLHKIARFMHKVQEPFSRVVLKLSSHPMQVQKRYLELQIRRAYSSLNMPIDDITVLGLKIK